MTTDPVSNVRVNVAELLSGWTPCFGCPWEQTHNDAGTENPWSWLLARSDIRECVRRLSRDDNDVYLKIKLVSPLFPDQVFSSVSCRGLKEPPGGTDVIQMVTTITNSVDSQAGIVVIDDEPKVSTTYDEANVEAFKEYAQSTKGVDEDEDKLVCQLQQMNVTADEHASVEDRKCDPDVDAPSETITSDEAND